jgi:hypothetical protein
VVYFHESVFLGCKESQNHRLHLAKKVAVWQKCHKLIGV